jgi:TolA-binding protein
LAVLEEFKNSNPQKSDLESIEYESGKRLYFDQKYPEAIKTLNKFLTSYPNSTFSYDANYYLADASYRTGKFVEALPPYQKVLDMNKGTYTNRSLFKVAEIHYALGHYQEAMKYYLLLQASAASKKETANALQGMMLSYYQIASYDSSLAYAKSIVQSGYATTTGQNKAYLYLGKSSLAMEDTASALDYFVATLNEAQDEHGAEAQYTIAQIFYSQKKFKSSLNELFNLNEQYSEYTAWVGKSFLLISENYLVLKETFQAKATLESIAKNFPDPAIVELAKQKLEAMKQMGKEGGQ